MIVYDDSMQVFHSSLIEDSVYHGGFSSRYAGDGRQRSTLINFSEKNSIPYESIVVPDQTHSINVEEVTKSGGFIKVVETTDGVVTKDNNVFLTVVTADCLPIIFVDKKKGVVGISHQGWRGSLKYMAIHMVKKMIALGADRDSISVVIGPGIGACCYSVYGARLYDFLSEFEKWKELIILKRLGNTYINLSRLNFLQLVEFGINKKHIDFFPFCTKCDKKRFFSYQRDDKKSYGEMFSYILKT